MLCGIVDLGSNTIRLSVYQYDQGQFQAILNQKAMAGLAGYVKDGALSDSGILVACRTLSSYRSLLDNFSIPEMHVFATASLRNISNTQEAVEAIRQVTGLTVEVLDGDQEALYSFRGAMMAGGLSGGLLTDIGGGSVELVTSEGMTITSACSLPMGSLSLYSKYVEGLFPTSEERKAIKSHINQQLEQANPQGLEYKSLCGVGGSIRAAAKLAVDLFDLEHDCKTFTADQLQELYKILKKGDKPALKQILHTVPDRVHTILPGLMLLNGVVKAYGIQEITASAAGVREGYLLERVMGESL